MTIYVAKTEEDIRRCYPVMNQLRTQLAEPEFVTRVQRQTSKFGYTLILGEQDGEINAVAGFRISECLCDGKYLYIDDFVTDELKRSKRYGDLLFDWIVEYARENDCKEIGLESGVQRFAAHRFYLRKRMKISSHHFSLDLRET